MSRGGGREGILGAGPFGARVLATVVAVGLAGCPAPDLMDPRMESVPLSGLDVEAVASVEGGASRLAFRGHAYGYQFVDGRYQARYLDAGEVRVGGWRTGRRNVRVGEPEYVLERPLREVPGALDVALEGRGRVPSCTLRLRFPTVALPAVGGEVRLDRGVVLPLGFDPASLAPGQRVTAEARLVRDGAVLGGGPVRWSDVRSALVVPPERLAGVSAGDAELVLRLEWRHASYASQEEGACAERLLWRAAFEARRRVVLRGGEVAG